MLVVLAAPSGTGKSTIARALFERRCTLAFSVSHTTRPARPGEVDGEHYHFVDNGRFDAMVAADEFAEWAQVHKRRYGTTKAEVLRLSARQCDILLDVDVQGAEQLMAAYPEAVSIFVVPPSLDELEKRLRNRGTESADQLATRMANARRELACADRFGYLVVNEVLEHAVNQIDAICEAESCKRSRNAALMARVRDMSGAHS